MYLLIIFTPILINTTKHMKNLLSLLFLMFLPCIGFSAIINVDNNPNRPPGYYDNLQLAINNASAGDTIYVYPSGASYGNITILKKLHLFGPGYNGTLSSVARIEKLMLDTATSPASNSSGSTIQGFSFASKITCLKQGIINIIISGNYFNSGSCIIELSGSCSNWLISNNYIKGYIQLAYNLNIIISNNVFSTYYDPVRDASSPSVMITHNLFMNFEKFSSLSNAVISNNIFICKSAYTSGGMSNNIFLNNLSYRDGVLNNYDLPPSGNSGSGNLSNTNPSFVNGTLTGHYDQTKDYHLQSSSPAKNAATDGTDIGQYGGVAPFVWGGGFTIPRITSTTITNPVINQSTPVNVNVKANKAKL